MVRRTSQARKYAIPFFSRYTIHLPFRVHDNQAGRDIAITHYRNQRAHVYDDTGRRRTLSILTLAALAFHGQSPTDQPYRVYHYGGSITPQTVKWLPQREMLRRFRSTLTPRQQMQVLDRWEIGQTQDAIAAHFGVSQPVINRIVNRRYHEEKANG